MVASRIHVLLALLLVGGCGTTYEVWYGYSPDRRHRIEVVEKNGRQSVQIDGAASEPYLGVALESITFSDDSQLLAYAAETREGWFVVLDSVVGNSAKGVADATYGPWSGVSEVRFGPNRRLAYVAADSGRWRIVVDGRHSPSYDAVMQGSLTFSPVGDRYAFVIAEGDGFRVVADGKAGALFDAIGALRFGPNDERIAYAASSGGRHHLVVDHRLLGPFNSLADFTLGPELRLGMLIQEAEGWRAVIDGRKGSVFRSISSIHFSPGGSYAYAAERDGAWVVILNGQRIEASGGVGQLAFAGESLVYEEIRDRDRFVVVYGVRDGPSDAESGPPRRVVGPPLKHVGRLTVSPAGGNFAYLAEPRTGGLAVFHGDAVHPIPLAINGTLVLSDDGRHWACLTLSEVKEGMEIVIDGVPTRPFDPEEMFARVMISPDASSDEHERILRGWVRAELNVFLADQDATQHR